MVRAKSMMGMLVCCLLAVVAGCNRSSTTTYSTSEYEREHGAYATARTERKQTEQKGTWSRQDKHDKHDMTSRSMAFPTGDQGSSVLLVSKQMPQKIRAGAPFEYKLTVKNISDQPLEGVVVYDRVPSEMSVRLSDRERERMTAQSATSTTATRQTVTTQERFVVREYEPGVFGRDPFLPRYTPIPTADELQAGEAYAVERGGRRTAEGKVELGPTQGAEASATVRDRRDTRPGETTRVEGQADTRTQTVETQRQNTRIEAREQNYAVERAGDHQGHQAAAGNRAFLAGEWYVGHLAPGETRTLTLSGTAPQSGQLATCTTVAYQPTICLVTEVVKPQLRIDRIAPERADACEEITITYRVTNVGTGEATGIVIEEQLPEGQLIATRQQQQQQRNVRFELNRLREGQSEDFTVRTRFDKRGTYRGQATATDEYGVKVQSAESATQVVAPELAIDVTAPEQAYTSRPLNYTIRVTNNGDGPANNLNVRLSMPQGVGRTVQTSEGGSAKGNQIVWENLRALKPGESIELRTGIEGSREGALSATATAEARCAQPVSDTAQTTLQAVGSLLLEVVDTNDPVPLNSNEVYKITVTNQGDKEDTNIRFVVTLPAEMDFADARAAVQPQVQGKTITFTIPRLAPKASETIQLSAKAMRAGDVRFKVEMNSDQLTSPVMETEATQLY